MGWLIPVVLVLLFVGILLNRKTKPAAKRVAVCEYWIYLPEAKLPAQDALMTRMISENPFNQKGAPCIGAKEGLLFSDIRLHLGLATRAKNPNIFRPDLFNDQVDPTSETLGRLAQANGIAKARYLSEVELKDNRHLQFMPHMAATVADLAQGSAIFDTVEEKLFTKEEFDAMLAENPDCSRWDVHVRLLWVPTEFGGAAETKGMGKVGLPDLKTNESPSDHRVLIMGLIEEASRRLFESPSLPDSMEIEQFGDSFLLHFNPSAGTSPAMVSIQRRSPL